jgi:hypothetical protein
MLYMVFNTRGSRAARVPKRVASERCMFKNQQEMTIAFKWVAMNAARAGTSSVDTNCCILSIPSFEFSKIAALYIMGSGL